MLVTTATVSSPAHSVNRPNQTSVGTIVWLSSELMFFAGLFAMYFTHRSVNYEAWPEYSGLLDVRYALIFTTILVASSFTCQAGVFAAERGDARGMRLWFIITFIMGSVFMAGQVAEYAKLVSEGLTISSSSYGSVFYLTTGFHGLHVAGGLVAFLFAIASSYTGKVFTHAKATRAIVVSYYWHFVDVVWIGLFAMIYLIK
jgi:cytochrome c oxidase subunit 3